MTASKAPQIFHRNWEKDRKELIRVNVRVRVYVRMWFEGGQGQGDSDRRQKMMSERYFSVNRRVGIRDSWVSNTRLIIITLANVVVVVQTRPGTLLHRCNTHCPSPTSQTKLIPSKTTTHHWHKAYRYYGETVILSDVTRCHGNAGRASDWTRMTSEKRS